MKRTLIISLIVFAARGSCGAQDQAGAGIVVSQRGNHVRILLDGTLREAGSGDTIRLTPGTHTIEQVIGSAFRWTVHRLVDTVHLAPGEMLTVPALSEAEHMITSQPTGARVYRNGTLLGTTPFMFRHSEDSEGTVNLTLEGFETRTVVPTRTVEHVFLIRKSDEPQTAGVLRSIHPSLDQETLTIASAVAMIGSSIAAAYLKERANKALDEYQRTGSSSALDDVRRYDNYSAVAAATMVISFTGFAYLIAFE